ncbi:MAG: tetratricopeptide repeat protein [Candidatus Omnitrophota bacterium]
MVLSKTRIFYTFAAKSIRGLKAAVFGRESMSLKGEPRALARVGLHCALLFVLAATFVSFFPTLGADFVNWDDYVYVVENPAIRHASLPNLKTIFSSFYFGNYQPLVLLTYLCDYAVFKLNPWGYHLVNLCLHLFNCALVFVLIGAVSGSIFVAFLTALLFGLHPLHVESVAWVSERKDVLYAFFYLAAMICYWKYLIRRPGRKYYAAAVFLFLCSLLSKSMAITLPVVLWLLDLTRSRRVNRWFFIDKIPFFFLSSVFGFLTLASQVARPLAVQEVLSNLKIALSTTNYSVLFYLKKIVMPVKLSALYPYYGSEGFSQFFISSLLLLFAFVLAIKYFKSVRRVLIFGIGFFLVTLFPVLQWVPFGEAIVADRYVYVSSLGLFAIAAELLFLFWRTPGRLLRSRRLAVVMLATAAAGSLAFLTWQRCGVWKDSIALWSDVLDKYPDSTTAYANRGAAYFKQGQYEKAQSDFQHMDGSHALYYRRDTAQARLLYLFHLSNSLNAQGRYEEAARILEEAVKENPKEGYRYYTNLAIAYALKGQTEEAEKLLEELLKNNVVNKAGPYYNLGLISYYSGDLGKAETYFRQSAEIHPGQGEAYYSLARVFHDRQQLPQAIAQYKKALEHNPRNAQFYNDLSVALFATEQYGASLSACRKALGCDASLTDAHVNCGNAFLILGRYRQAIDSFRRALALDPQCSVAHSNLALAYYYVQNYSLAVEHLKEALRCGYAVPDGIRAYLRPYWEDRS